LKKIFITFTALLISSCQKDQPTDAGYKNGLFSACGDYSCFSTTEVNKEHKIDPIKYREPKTEVLKEIKRYAMLIGEAKVLSESAEYLHIEYKGFLNTDDLEIFVNAKTQVIEYKISARGSLDFGSTKNRAHDLGFKYIQRGM